MKRILFIALLIACNASVFSQEAFRYEGPANNPSGYYCFYNAVLHINPDQVIEKGTLIIKDGIIIEINTSSNVPSGATGIDLKGKHIYPSFIDLYTDYGFIEQKRTETGRGGTPQYQSAKKGAFYWNESVHPETRSADEFNPESKSAAEYRAIGFGVLCTHRPDGIVRGTSVLVTLQDKSANQVVMKSDAAMQYSFKKGSSRQQYPQSVMGSIALLKQLFYDAQWYATVKAKKEENLSLQALNSYKNIPQIFDASDKYNILRADLVGDEFGIQFIFKSDGKEYQRVKNIVKTNGSFIVPVNFPDAYDVEDYYNAMMVSLEDMKHWELAPSNANFLFKEKAKFVFTSNGLKDKKSFISNLKLVIRHGLPEAEVIRALTVRPAELIGVNDQLGTLEKGKVANFFISSTSLFKDENVIYENWVRGEQYKITDQETIDIRGDYDLNIQNNIYVLKVKGDLKKPMATIKVDTSTVKVKIVTEQKNISLSFILKDKNYNGALLLGGNINFDSGSWDGNGQIPNGNSIKWNAVRKNRFTEPKKEKSDKDTLILGKIWLPNIAYGWDTLVPPKQILIKNTTVWTNESDGILKNTDVLVRDGKIVKIGKILDVVDKTTRVIDGTNKHLTCGIIDEHSHIAISGGVNEGSHAVTAEVSIADVINPDDINIYRQLAGGVTTSQLLHGSANPIGGRSALIKLKWGRTAEEMKIENADGFIKCALGENVKQSNWGEQFSTRYPQTRMGVEQVFYDAFYRAKAYETTWKEYYTASKKSKGIDPPKKDIQLEVLLEILNSKRFITCHSYVQSEINMLMHVADSMGFTINTFTHILEGYKVADKMKKHGVHASTFSDWWAYKYEVIEAIPYNAAILASVGVLTGINSDDAEMARRLNQEAAKAVKYGGMSEENAWKLVTLNPATMLHLQDRIGSVKVGKDADLVLWSDNPLSVYAKVEYTLIEGFIYFDAKKDLLLREIIQQERLRLIAKMIAAKQGGAATQAPMKRDQLLYHCETMGDFTNEEN